MNLLLCKQLNINSVSVYKLEMEEKLASRNNVKQTHYQFTTETFKLNRKKSPDCSGKHRKVNICSVSTLVYFYNWKSCFSLNPIEVYNEPERTDSMAQMLFSERHHKSICVINQSVKEDMFPLIFYITEAIFAFDIHVSKAANNMES